MHDYEEIYAYGDSRGDLELLDFSDKPFTNPLGIKIIPFIIRFKFF